jgi:hypothetical protein
MSLASDLRLAARAKLHGANYALRIIRESRGHGIPISAGFALVQKETYFRNIFGHDGTTSIPNSWKGGAVTKSRYAYYKARRPTHGMQGVGPTQLTWYSFQDEADKLGGCWRPGINIHVGLRNFSASFKTYVARGQTRRTALQSAAHDYNGTGAAADAYGRDFLVQMDKWHNILNTK